MGVPCLSEVISLPKCVYSTQSLKLIAQFLSRDSWFSTGAPGKCEHVQFAFPICAWVQKLICELVQAATLLFTFRRHFPSRSCTKIRFSQFRLSWTALFLGAGVLLYTEHLNLNLKSFTTFFNTFKKHFITSTTKAWFILDMSASALECTRQMFYFLFSRGVKST